MYDELIRNVVFKNFKTKTFDFEEVSKFGNSKVFLLKIKYKKYILRITKDIYSVFNNSYALKLLSKLDSTPKLIANGVINEFQYSIETFLEGKELVEMDSKKIKSIFTNISKIHSYENTKCGYLNELGDDLSSFVKTQLIEPYIEKYKEVYNSQEIIEYLMNNLPSNKATYSFLHGDLNEFNIFLKNKDSLFFDFEGAFYGEKEYDIGYFLFRIGTSNEYLELIKERYDLKKVMYYALCIMIRKIAKSKDFELEERIKRLEDIYKLIVKL